MNTPLVKRAYNLGLKAVPNFVEVLDEERISYYEDHLDELSTAIRRGFILPGQIASGDVSVATAMMSAPPRVTAPPPLIYNVADTDLDMWLGKEEELAKKHLGVDVKLRELFDIPPQLPWKSVIPVFCPAGLDNRGMIKVLRDMGFKKPYEETDVMNYSGSQALDVPTLHLIENSERPNEDTMGLSANQMRETGKLFLRLRGYGLAMGLYHFVTKGYLDPKETFTRFPEDRLPGGDVAHGRWGPDPRCRNVRFYWNGPDNGYPYGGGRVAMPVSLKTP